MTNLILLRHGETNWNVEGRWQGQIDIPLNENGHRQAETSAKSLMNFPITAIYSSDLKRAIATAEQVGKVKSLPVITDIRLREIDQGIWQGMHISAIKTQFQQRYKERIENPDRVAPPGGESALQVSERVLPCLMEIVQKHPQETVLIVTHGFVTALICVYYKNDPIEKIWENIPLPGVWLEFDVIENNIHNYQNRYRRMAALDS